MELLIFDLDGTLADTRLDLANAVNFTLGRMSKAPLANEVVYSYVGNGAPLLIRRAMGPQATDSEVQQALTEFLAHYAQHDLENTTLYPGVRAALDRFRAAGKRMAVLTNKPARMTRTIVDGLGVAEHFFRLYGGDSLAEKKPHPMGVEKLMAEAGIGRDQTMMIGDSSVDVITARNAGIAACGVTWGFKPETLDDPKPDILIDRMEQLTERLLF
jgi:phosphoglycolate phosphatase